MANYAKSPKMELVISSAIALHSRHGSRRSCMISRSARALYSCNHSSISSSNHSSFVSVSSMSSSNHCSFVSFSLLYFLVTSQLEDTLSHFTRYTLITPPSYVYQSCVAVISVASSPTGIHVSCRLVTISAVLCKSFHLIHFNTLFR